MNTNNLKIVVFDFDETLGYFVQLSIFLDCINKYLKSELKLPELTQDQFNNLLDLYPEFLRPNIIAILNYLKYKKESKCCNKLMIYTNNQGPKKWASLIISYFETKLKHKLFDQVISAFKINGKQIEICRTSHEKSHKDFIRCTKLPNTAEICFLDDNYYPQMSHKNVYYINIKPYIHDLPFQELLDRFTKSNILSSEMVDKSDFNKKMLEQFKTYNFDITEKNMEEYNIDKILSKKIMVHLQDFFNTSLNSLSNKIYKKTNKNSKSNKVNKMSKNKTKKNQRNIDI
jgi:hypothetical protein